MLENGYMENKEEMVKISHPFDSSLLPYKILLSLFVIFIIAFTTKVIYRYFLADVIFNSDITHAEDRL